MSDEKLLTYRDYEPDDEGREQILRHLHFRAHGMRAPRVPPRVRTNVVETVLTEELKLGLNCSEIQYAAQIARFYRVRSAAPRFLALLAKRENSANDFIASFAAISAIADLGEAPQLARAEQYYASLLRQSTLETFADAAIECFFDLPESVTPKQLADALKKRSEALKDRPDPASQDARRTLESQLLGTVPITAEARQAKNKILAQTDAESRATSLAEAYIGVDDPGGVEWRIWGSYALREELVKSGETVVVKGVQMAMGKIPASGDAEAITNMKAAAARALVYFGGQLTAEQRDWLAPEVAPPLPLEG
jgi:hypothetical protein